MVILNREGLNERIVQAIRASGWSVLYLSSLTSHPFKVRAYLDDGTLDLLIYCWNLSHGGKTRSGDEYRIQAKVPSFQTKVGFKTLILGWWDDIQVFAGFDFEKHPGPLGYSSSIQISKGTLLKAKQTGLSTHNKGNREVAVAFKPEMFMAYAMDLEHIHAFGATAKELSAFESLIDRVGVGLQEKHFDQALERNQSLLNLVSQKRQSTVTTITRKIREADFKARVLTAYNFSCAFCALQMNLVEAAHIVPVANDASTDSTANGLAVCPLHHRAYDRALITIDESYETKINEGGIETLKKANRAGGLREFQSNLKPMILLPPDKKDRPHVEYVRMANRIREWSL